MRGIVFGYDQEPGGVFIDAVNDAGTDDAVDRAQIFQAKEQRVHERAREVAVPGMHGKALRLIDHGDVVVFIHDIERDILRREVERLRRGDMRPRRSRGKLLLQHR